METRFPLNKITRRATNLITNEGGTFARVFFGSGMLFAFKQVCIALNVWFDWMPMWLLYLIVHVLANIVGWVYHTVVSFRVEFSDRSLFRYVTANIAAALTDYGLFWVFVYPLRLQANLASLFVAGIIFLLRYVLYSRFVFLEQATAPAVED